MIAPAKKPNQRNAIILGGVILVLAILGVLLVLGWLLHLVEHVVTAKPVSHDLQVVWKAVTDWTNTYATPIGTILLAIATLFLWRANVVLARAANAQLSINSPYLSVTFLPDQQQQLAGNPQYFQEWTNQDNANTRLQPYVSGNPRYVQVSVKNEQSNPHGVAVNIRVNAALCWGGTDGDATRPYEMARTIFFTAVASGSTETGPIFNVGTLPAFKVIVTDVGYLDIGRRKRRGAYTCGFDLWSTGFFKRLPLVMEPDKGEIGFWRIGKRG